MLAPIQGDHLAGDRRRVKKKADGAAEFGEGRTPLQWETVYLRLEILRPLSLRNQRRTGADCIDPNPWGIGLAMVCVAVHSVALDSV